MKKLMFLLAVVVLAATSVPRLLAADAGAVTLTGTMVCGKCTLHITKECQNVLLVPDPSGTTNYFFLAQNKVSKDFHQNICMNDGEKTTVTGTINEKHGQEVLTPTSITPVK
jgi:hypothetical protein